MNMDAQTYPIDWPYPIECDENSRVATDVLVLGGGIAGMQSALLLAEKNHHEVLMAMVDQRGVDAPTR